jgi:hypothetical protein
MLIATTTTIMASAITHDLTDLETAKDELQIKAMDTANDAFIGRAITQASAAIASYCNRVFAVETVQDVIYPRIGAGGGIAPLQLSRWPVIPDSAILTTSAPTASGLVLHFAATAGVSVGQPVAGDNIPVGAVVASFVTKTSVTLNVPVSGAIADGATVRLGVAVTMTGANGTMTSLVSGTDYTIDPVCGWLIRLGAGGIPTAWTAATMTVVYQAGYDTMPADIEDATLRVIAQRWAGRGRDPLLKSQSQPGLGDQTYWIGTVPGVRGVFTEEIAGLLDAYRVPLIG